MFDNGVRLSTLSLILSNTNLIFICFIQLFIIFHFQLDYHKQYSWSHMKKWHPRITQLLYKQFVDLHNQMDPTNVECKHKL